MTLIDDDKVEKVGREFFVDVHLLLGSSHRLVQREVDLVRFVDPPVGDFSHRPAEGLEVVDTGLIDQNVSISKEQDALLDSRIPRA